MEQAFVIKQNDAQLDINKVEKMKVYCMHIFPKIS